MMRIRNILVKTCYQILEETKTQVPISIGLLNFHRIAVAITVNWNEG